MTPLRKEKDERRANYEKRRDQRRRSVHSSDHEAKKEIPKLTSTPKKTKKPKAQLFKLFPYRAPSGYSESPLGGAKGIYFEAE